MKFNILILSIFLSFLVSTEIGAQHLRIAPDGMVIPKTDHTAIVLEENGQMTYDTVTKSIWYYNNTIWKEVGSDNLGNHTATDSLNMANKRIYNVDTPLDGMDAANKAYVDQDLDQDPLNEIQTLSASVEGDTMYLSASNWLIVPGISDANYIKDFDGNVYTEVEIGSQVWLKENLSTTHYIDGTPIPKIEVNADWDDWNASWNGTEYTDVYDAYSWYSNDSTTYSKFGALYNWGVVDSTINGGKNACPVGYIVPTETDWDDLLSGLSTPQSAKLKYPSGGEWWINDNNYPFGSNGNNSTGFSAVGSGVRGTTGPFSDNKIRTLFWTRTGGVNQNIHAFRVEDGEYNVTEVSNAKGAEGHSIRCIKEE